MCLGCPECGSLTTHVHVEGCRIAERELIDAAAQVMFAVIMTKTAAFKENQQEAFWLLPALVRDAFRVEARSFITGLREKGLKIERTTNVD